MCVSTNKEEEIPATRNAAQIETVICDPSACQPDVPQISDRHTGQILYFRKKELKISESSAFFTYTKSTTPNSNTQGPPSGLEDERQHMKVAEHISMGSGQVGIDIQEEGNAKTLENHSHGDEYHCSNSFHDSFSAERSCTPISHDISQPRNPDDEFSHPHVHAKNVSPNDVTSCYTHAAYPYYIPGVMNQVTMPPASMYHKHTLDKHNHSNPAILPQYNHIPQCPPHAQEMPPYPYYPFVICLQHRPRLRGQFVRKVNGIIVDLNGQPDSAEEDEEDEEEYDEEEDDS